MAIDKILTWADFADERRLAPGSITHHKESTYTEYLTRLWEIYHDDSDLPSKPAGPDTIAAFVNCGRWMVSCQCGVSAPAEPGEDYLCPSCETWMSIEFPSNRTEIETQLLALGGYRLQAPLRNWRPQ